MAPHPTVDLMLDSSLSTDARVLGWFVHMRTKKHPTEISNAEFADQLGSDTSRERVQRALAQLVRKKRIARKRGGRGHHDLYQFLTAEADADSYPEFRQLNGDIDDGIPAPNGADSYREIRQLSDIATGKSVTYPEPSRAATRTDAVLLSLTETETDKQTERFASPRARTALHAHLGTREEVVERMDAVPNQSTTWQAALMGLYGPSGTDRMVWRATPPADEPALLAKAIDRAAGEGRRYNGRFFRRILETVIDERSNNGRGSAGQGGSQARPDQSHRRQRGFDTG